MGKGEVQTDGHTGKSNLLFFLAAKTGSELKSRSEVTGKEKMILKGRNSTHKILINIPSGSIVISSKSSQRQTSMSAAQPKRNEEESTYSGKKVVKKEREQKSAVNAEDKKDEASPNRKIMNDSEEVNKLKALCRKHKGESYPPER